MTPSVPLCLCGFFRHVVCSPLPSVRADVPKPTLESRLDRLERVIACCFICAKGVMARYGWSKATFYRRRHDPHFPEPRKFPGHVWTIAELEAAEQAGHLPYPSN